MLSIEYYSCDFREGLAASLTRVAMYSTLRFTDLFKVRSSLIALQFAIIWQVAFGQKSLVRVSPFMLPPSG